MELSEREYWRPAEAASVLGRSATYWTRMFNAGVVRGYDEHGIHLQAASCRAHLERLYDLQEQAGDAVGREIQGMERYKQAKRDRSQGEEPIGAWQIFRERQRQRKGG